MTSKEPDRLSHRAAKQFITIARLQRSVVESRVRQTGVYRSQHQILMYIAANPDASQKDIARMHETSTATIAVSLKKLEKAGYIRREVDESDNRFNRIQVTEKGLAVVEKSRAIFARLEEEMFEGFEEEDYQVLESLLDRVCQNIKKMNGGI